jgi:aromatic-L-amino-acid decarboxylase
VQCVITAPSDDLAEAGGVPAAAVGSPVMAALDVPDDVFRHLAARIVDRSASYLATLDARPVVPRVSGEDTLALFDRPAPETGIGEGIVDELDAIADASRAATGRMFPYVAAPAEPVAALADLYASVLNNNVTAWRSAPAAVTIERSVVRWLAEAIGCATHTGVLVGGGSAANLAGLALAREARAPANARGARPAIVYASAEVHMSIPKALALLGLGTDNLRRIPVDDLFRMDVAALERQIASDRAAGAEAIAIVATAGTIETGAIDPLGAIADVAERHGLWLHVDGAYGAPAAMVRPELFVGLERADSLSLDAHKWLYQPLDVSLVLHRHPDVARATFAAADAYVKPLSTDPVEAFAFFDETIELSRRFRALKLWASLRYHGLAAFREAIGDDLRHAALLAGAVDREADLERLAPVELSTVCFRHRAPGEDTDAYNVELLRRVNARGRVALSNARIRGAFALRACVVNHRTTDDDVAAVVDEVLAAAAELRNEQ